MGRIAMEVLDKKTQKRLLSYSNALIRTARDNILTIIIYGDITFNLPGSIQSIIVVKEINSHFLLSYAKLKKKFTHFAPPLFFTPDILKSSNDVFPVELLNIKDSYIVLYGEDLLQQISITFDELRTEVEQQIKRHYLKILDDFLYSHKSKADLEQFLTTSLIGMVPIFKNVLRLIKKECPIEGTLFKEFCEELGLDDKPFFDIWDIKTGRKRFTKRELLQTFDSYIKEIKKLISRLETLRSDEGYCIQ